MLRPGCVDLFADATNISKFLNRLLGIPVKLQNQLFNYFTDTLGVLLVQAKRMGKYDGGILGRVDRRGCGGWVRIS